MPGVLSPRTTPPSIRAAGSSQPETPSPEHRPWSRLSRRARRPPRWWLGISGERTLAGGVEEQAVLAAGPPQEKIEKTSGSSAASGPRRSASATSPRRPLPSRAAEAQAEAERCLTCGSRSKIAYLDDCQVCKLCQQYCPTDAIEMTEGALLGSLHGWDVVELGR